MGDELTAVFLVAAPLWSGLGVGAALLLTRRRPATFRVLAILFALALASLATTMTLFVY